MTLMDWPGVMNRRRILSAAMLGPALALTGCAARGPRYEPRDPPPGQALVYIYRVHRAQRPIDLAPMVLVNDQEIGGLSEEGYLATSVAPGETVVRTAHRPYAWPKGAPVHWVRLEAIAGQVHFVQFTITHVNIEFPLGVGRGSITTIGADLAIKPREEAERHLVNLRLA